VTLQPFDLAGRRVAADTLPLFLPDIDVYFKGDIDVAKTLVLALQRAGGDFVKGALLHSPDLGYDGDIETTFFKQGEGVVRERYRTIIERHVVPLPIADEIYTFARDLGMKVVLSVYDDAGVEFCVRHAVAGVKIPSSNITHPQLIRLAASSGIPLILDTGKSTVDEIDRAVDAVFAGGAKQFAMQHSPEAPPAPMERHFLRMIPFLSQRYGVQTGLSDHHAGGDMFVAAIALGATFLEKGVCADDASPDIDLAHAARISDVPDLMGRIEATWRALGDAPRQFPPDRPLPLDRMSIIASRAIKAGDDFTLENIRFAFAAPPTAVPAAAWDQLQGRRAQKPIAANEPIELRHLEHLSE
jgi:sialic acid synthase SpsE